MELRDPFCAVVHLFTAAWALVAYGAYVLKKLKHISYL